MSVRNVSPGGRLTGRAGKSAAEAEEQAQGSRMNNTPHVKWREHDRISVALCGMRRSGLELLSLPEFTRFGKGGNPAAERLFQIWSAVIYYRFSLPRSGLSEFGVR